MILSLIRAALTLAMSLAASVTIAQSAHVHGEGKINIAIDGDRLFMTLESPGADIVGFEHEARSAEEKSAIAKAIARLREPMQMLQFSPTAECEAVQSSAGIGNDKPEHKDDDHHDEEHDDDSHGGEKHDGEKHGVFTAEYEFRCTDMGSLALVEFTYFRHFANAQLLDVVLIDGNGQRHMEIERADPVLRFDR